MFVSRHDEGEDGIAVDARFLRLSVERRSIERLHLRLSVERLFVERRSSLASSASPSSASPTLRQGYNATAWIGLLEQLNSYELKYNAVRMYSMDPAADYSEFFRAAARLGVYVMVPLTSRSGEGVLDRNSPAPPKVLP